MTKKIFGILGGVLLTFSSSFGQDAPSSRISERTEPTVAEQLQLLKQQVKQQQERIDQLEQQHKQQQQDGAQVVNTSVIDLKSSATLQNLQLTAQDTQKKVQELDRPLSIHYKGLNITPGGFITSEFFFRSRNENSDANSSLGGAPFGGTVNGSLTEFRASARPTRPAILLEAMAGSTRLSGYAAVSYTHLTLPTTPYV